MSRDEIPPGGEGEIKVALSIKNHPGPVTKQVRVMTDDPVNPVTTLTISAQVVVPVGFETQRLYFKRLVMGETEKRRVKILVEDPEKIEFGKAVTTVKGLTASVVREEGADRRANYFLDLIFEAQKYGPIRGYVTVPTNHEKTPQIRLSLSGVVTPRISVAPRRLNMGTRDIDETRNIIIVRSAKDKFLIKETHDESGRIEVQVKTLTPGTSYQLNVHLTEKGLKDKTQGFSTVLKITTDSEYQPLLEIPVMVKATRS